MTCKLLGCKNELARSCKNLARILLSRDMLFLHDSCTILHIPCKKWRKTDFARDAARISCTFFAGKILQELVQECARIVQEKGPYRVQDLHARSCKILAQSCMILQVRFCWVVADYQAFMVHAMTPNLEGGYMYTLSSTRRYVTVWVPTGKKRL